MNILDMVSSFFMTLFFSSFVTKKKSSRNRKKKLKIPVSYLKKKKLKSSRNRKKIIKIPFLYRKYNNKKIVTIAEKMTNTSKTDTSSLVDLSFSVPSKYIFTRFFFNLIKWHWKFCNFSSVKFALQSGKNG